MDAGTVKLVVGDPANRAYAVRSLQATAEPNAHDIPIRLADRAGIRGTVVSPDGKPIPSVQVAVRMLGGVIRSQDVASSRAVWPEAVRATVDGRFHVGGIDAAEGAILTVHDEERRLFGSVVLKPGSKPANDLVLKIERTRRFRARILAEDTSQPLVDTQISVSYDYVTTDGHVRARNAATNRDGTVEMDVPLVDRHWFINVVRNDSYLGVFQSVPVSTGADPVDLEIRLPRGRWVAGRVANTGTGQPIPQVKVRFHLTREGMNQLQRNPRPATLLVGLADAAFTKPVVTDTDGRFRLLVPKADGVVAAVARDRNFVSVVPPADTLDVPPTAHAYERLPLNSSNVALALKLGQSIEALARAPDGTLIESGQALCCQLMGREQLNEFQPAEIVRGRFAIPGCERGREYTVIVTDSSRSLGAVAKLRCDDVRQNVALERCTATKIRFQSNRGTIVPNVKLSVDLKIQSDDQSSQENECWQHVISTRTDEHGTANLSGLVSGATYRVVTRPEQTSMAMFLLKAPVLDPEGITVTSSLIDWSTVRDRSKTMNER